MTADNNDGKEPGNGFSGLASLIPEVEGKSAASVPPAAPSGETPPPLVAITPSRASDQSGTKATGPEKPNSSWDWLLPTIVGFVLVKLSGLLGVLICFGAYYFLKPKIGTWGAIAASAGIVVITGMAITALAAPMTEKDCIAKYRVYSAGTQRAVGLGIVACRSLSEGKSTFGNGFKSTCVLDDISQVKADNGLGLLIRSCSTK